MNDTEIKVVRCFSNVFPGLPADEIPGASTASLATWDSMAHIRLLSSIGEEFGLELDMDDFEELVSYPLIIEYLEKNSAHT
jgi:acyl carrier protein